MFLRLVCTSFLLTSAAAAGINWKSVWLEPRIPVVVTAGETKPYTVMGLNGADITADLTKSPYLKISSTDPDVLAIDPVKGLFIGKKAGHADVRIQFSEVSALVSAFVQEPAASAAAVSSRSSLDGVWRAEFTGPLGERPKMVSEIVFSLQSTASSLTGTVHADHWPGDAAISDGRVDGDRVRFTMTGHLPFEANGVTGYPKLCFDGVRTGADMKIELRWTEAQSACSEGRLLPMTAKRIGD